MSANSDFGFKFCKNGNHSLIDFTQHQILSCMAEVIIIELILNSIFSSSEDWSPAGMCHYHVIIWILWPLIGMRSVMNWDDYIWNTLSQVNGYFMWIIMLSFNLCRKLIKNQHFDHYASAFRRRRHYVFGLSVRPSVCPSVRPKPEIPSFDLYMGPLVHPTKRNRFTACPSVCPSVCPEGFQAFARECIKGMAWNFTCRCILTISRTD